MSIPSAKYSKFTSEFNVEDWHGAR